MQFYAADESLELRVLRGGNEFLLQGEREYGVPLGLDFSSPTFDGLRRCKNACEFCFVTQMPPRASSQSSLVGGARRLRRSLYVRDDDYRYSVLYGSFITLTGLAPEDWQRLEEQRLSPLYVSVHSTENDLRQRLLGREDLAPILPQIDRLLDLGIEVHAQIVLVPGVNDGDHLDRSIADLAARYPGLLSIGVVPVGLTRYHRGTCRLYTALEARAIVDQVAPYQQRYRARYGLSLVYLADEWYLLAGMDVPPDEHYDDYGQIENGIGLVRQFLQDSSKVQVQGFELGTASCSLVCGTSIAPLMRQVAGDLAIKSGCRIEVVPVVNRLFGETVTVSGLLGGEDVLAALGERERLGEIVFLPRAMFSQPEGRGELLTLDDLLLRDLERAPGTAGDIGRLCERGLDADWEAAMISNPKHCPQCGTPLQVRLVGDRERPVCPGCGFIYYINPIVGVGALIEQEGRVALVRRGVEPGRGRWGLPAGYVEGDESAEEAAIRETWEEVNLRIELEGLLDAFSYGKGYDRGVLLVYVAHVLSGEIAAGDDAVDAAWFGPEELPDIAFRTHREALRQWRQAKAVVYRPATLADAEGVTMLGQVYPSEASGPFASFIGDAHKRLLVALDNGQVIGFTGIALDAIKRIAHVEQVFVHPRYRRWGIGTRLLLSGLSFSREAGMRALFAEASVSNPGWGVYLKAGFRVSGFTNDLYAFGSDEPETALLLTLNLASDSS